MCSSSDALSGFTSRLFFVVRAAFAPWRTCASPPAPDPRRAVGIKKYRYSRRSHLVLEEKMHGSRKVDTVSEACTTRSRSRPLTVPVKKKGRSVVTNVTLSLHQRQKDKKDKKESVSHDTALLDIIANGQHRSQRQAIPARHAALQRPQHIESTKRGDIRSEARPSHVTRFITTVNHFATDGNAFFLASFACMSPLRTERTHDHTKLTPAAKGTRRCTGTTLKLMNWAGTQSFQHCA